MFQHTAARRRLLIDQTPIKHSIRVSTHSRTKAAADLGWLDDGVNGVSTHSRTKAAACLAFSTIFAPACFNTQPHEGGCVQNFLEDYFVEKVSTHSRTKAAAAEIFKTYIIKMAFQHTAARRRLPQSLLEKLTAGAFQHTAARRRLPACDGILL